MSDILDDIISVIKDPRFRFTVESDGRVRGTVLVDIVDNDGVHCSVERPVCPITALYYRGTNQYLEPDDAGVAMGRMFYDLALYLLFHLNDIIVNAADDDSYSDCTTETGRLRARLVEAIQEKKRWLMS